MNVSSRIPFIPCFVGDVPKEPGVYIVFDLAGPIYAGRSRVDIHRRLASHLAGRGNKNLAMARRVGAAASLTFTYCVLPAAQQADVERILIASFGVAKYANLRREGLFEDDLLQREVARFGRRRA